MFEMQKNFNWGVHQNDPNNWVKIPEFDVIPSTVSFVGFAYPILGPKDRGFLWRVPVWETVKTVRLLAKRRFGTLVQLRVVSRSLYEQDLLNPEYEDFSEDQAFAFYYDAFFFNVQRAVTQSGKTLVDEQARSAELARVMETAVQLVAGQRPNQESVASVRSALARSGADAKHRDGRQAREWIRAEWAIHRGAYDGNRSAFARDYCARLWNERSVKVTEKQLREVWLRDAPPAGNPAGLQASR